ncbi:hypothetical protein EBU71_06280 [bacterium]|nr:hypothetical protein [Candidatus Elulimicrobium humile]
MSENLTYLYVKHNINFHNGKEEFTLPKECVIKMYHKETHGEYFIFCKGEEIPVCKANWFAILNTCPYISHIRDGHRKDREKKLNFLLNDKNSSYW